MAEVSENHDKDAYVHAEIPDQLRSLLYPNGAHNTVLIESVKHEGSYEAGKELQRKALTALSILMDDPEAKADIESAIERGYFMVLDDYDGGVDSEANSVLPIMSVVHDYDSRVLLKDDNGNETAASHVYVGRHEFRHLNQPEQFLGMQTMAYSPLDSLRATFWVEADAQAEAVAYSFDYYDKTGSAHMIADMINDDYVFSKCSIEALGYRDSKMFHFSDEKHDANIRAEAFLAWTSPEPHTDHYEALEGYIDGDLTSYQKMLEFFQGQEKDVSKFIDLYQRKSGDMSAEERQEAIKFFKDYDNAIEEAIGIKYTDLPLALETKPLSFDDLKVLGDRRFSDNYFDRTESKHGEEFKLLAEGSREDLENRLGIEIDQERLDEISELRADVALQHMSNLDKFKAILSLDESVDNTASLQQTEGSPAVAHKM
ncbi:MAG: hypothetical protein ACRBB3_03060 [Alphaproteobacteria bacterium]